jgi:octaprenyl-diphosphate synthase
MIILRSELNREEIKSIRDFFTSEDFTEEKLSYILSLMEQYDIKRKSEKFVDDYIFKAKDLLSEFEDNEFKESLLFLADYMVQRDR